MKYIYFITSEIKTWLEKKNIGNDAYDKLSNQIASDNQLNASVLMANLLVNKFNNHSGLRYVWLQEIRQDVCMYILRRIYRHDEYSKKINDATKPFLMERYSMSLSEKEEVDAEFSKFFKEEKKEALPEEYRQYEDARAFDKNRDVIFYEMPLWHDGMKKVPKDYWPFIQKALSEDIDKTYEQYDVFLYHTTNNFTLTYRYGDVNAIGKSDVYLLQIVKGKEPNLDELLDRKYDCEDVKTLQNSSSKCYPDYYTYDYPAWKEVEEDDLANLALSEEEIRILQNVQFPFFVSGLAGSGKSTILYYLYANIYKYVAVKYPDHNLLFLSYNDMLVDKARMSVKSILSYHNTNEGFKEYFEIEDNLQHFNNSFVPFREFLKNAFLDEQSIALFSEEKHITYEKFRELYQSEYKQAGKRLSASILWSVIRSFIKGRNLYYFTVDDYVSDEISRRDRTVDPKIYQEAYKIWDKWYRHYYENGEGWDDLDLVRFALTNGDFQNVYHNYAVIFCDEAQDFTKLEIDLILSLSKHSKYNLSLHPNDKRIPIAFAGDPNQTINPTGFRWAGTKAIFAESFRDSLDSYPELDDPELSKNYRSQLGIVKFANTIQCIRYNYFDETSKDRKLQSVREDPQGEYKDALEYVGFYSYDKFKNIIIDNLTNANIITSGDGEEGDLSLFPEIKNQQVKLNTAIGTKGLEYNAVMLLNFSKDPAYRLFQKILNEEPFNDDSERFEIAHFFTKLYIAISRAKAQLFIVDTDESYEFFWKYFIDHSLWESLVNRFIRDEEKRKLVGHITIGDIETLPQRLSDSYDAEENGRQAFEKARGEKSVSLMKRAQSYFLEAGLTALADECDAYIFLYNMEYVKAGDKFISLNQKDKRPIALTAYWKGYCWEKLINMIARRSDISSYDSIRLLVSQFMTDSITPGEFLQSLVNNIDQFQDALYSHLDDQIIWSVIFDKLKEELQTMDSVNISISITNNLDIVSRFIKWYDNGLSGLRADMYYARAQFINNTLDKNKAGFRPEAYERAIEIWEEAGLTDNKKYFNAKKITSSTISEEILWMNELQEHETICSLYGDYSTALSLTEEAAGVVFTCLLTKNYEKAVSYPYPKDVQIKWNRLYAQNHVLFLTDVVLADFTPQKFYFLADKVQLEESNIFDEKLPVSLFELIFALKGVDEKEMPYWTYFTSLLRDKNGVRVFKRSLNRERILESLSKHIVSGNEYDKSIASCFLEFLFDSDFNAKRADKYCRTLITIFGHDVFFKEDFRRSTERNKYFTSYSELDNDEHETIKNNIRRYVDYYLSSVKKLNSNTADDAKALLRAYEICVTYQGINPDYLSICNMYKKHIKEKKFAEVRDWMEQRMLFNQFMDDNMLKKASFAKLVASFDEKKQKLQALTDDFSKEDASMFVAVVNTCEEDPTYDSTLLTAKLIYIHHLRRDNLKPFCRVNDLIAKLPDAIDIAIDEVLSNKERVNEYAIKLLSYTWEALYEHSFVANHYDKLIGKKRLERLRILTEYLKKRALLHYSYLKKDLFEAKQEEYGIVMTKDYLPASYPKIEDKSIDRNQVGVSEAAMNDGTAAEAQNTKNGSEIKPKRAAKGKKGTMIMPSPLDVAKMAQLEMARNLKKMGVPVETIRQAAPQLTIEEIEKL